MNCPNCGLPANENDKFCIGCGTRLRNPEQEEAAEAVVRAVEEIPAEAAEAAEEAVETAVEEAPRFVPVQAAELPVEEPVKLPAQEAEIPYQAPVFVPEKPKAPEPVIEVKQPETKKPVIEAPAIEEIDEGCDAVNRLNKPLSVWGYIWRIVLFSLPIISIIPLFVMAFSKGINKNSKHFATAVLILMLIALILGVCGLIYLLITTDANTINQTINNILGR